MSTTYYLEGKGECHCCGNQNAVVRRPIMHSACGWKLVFYTGAHFIMPDPYSLVEYLIEHKSSVKLVDEIGNHHTAKDLMLMLVSRQQGLQVDREHHKVIDEGATWCMAEVDRETEVVRSLL